MKCQIEIFENLGNEIEMEFIVKGRAAKSFIPLNLDTIPSLQCAESRTNSTLNIIKVLGNIPTKQHSSKSFYED